MMRRTLVAVAVLSVMLRAALPAVSTPEKNPGASIGLKGDATDAITIPRPLSYQGKLLDNIGNPVADTLYAIRFTLYAQPTGGGPLWSEDQLVNTRAGLFSVLLGSVTPIGSLPDAGALYLGMKVGADPEMTPRIQIVSAAYAYIARKADTANYALAGGGGSGDNAWVRGTPDSVLYTVNRLGIARGGSDNMFYGNFRQSHVNFGVSCTTGASGRDFSNVTVSGGIANTAGAAWATVGGGLLNKAYGTGSAVMGGVGNTASGTGSAVAGGAGNVASGDYSVCGGSYGDTAMGFYSGVFSGYKNRAGDAAVDSCATVTGGYQNRATGKFAFVGGGRDNLAESVYAVVAGGDGNAARGRYATVSGGHDNVTESTYAVVAGGYRNAALAHRATVSGGEGDTASGDFATVGGGTRNRARGAGSCIAGGSANSIDSALGAIGGGFRNLTAGYAATVGGGYWNAARGSYSAIGGGYADTAAAAYSFAANNRSVVPTSYSNSAAFNGQTATASNQTRVGALSKASGTFTIDHPLEPYGTILNHYFIEGPEMRNIYDGEAVLDASGRAVVTLPDYFDALNRKPRVQLTGIGTSDVYLAEKVSGNRFVIGGKPGAEVYWQVTGERKDVSAEATRRMMPVEQPKTGALAGRMLDDEFLSGCMEQLGREGKAQGIDFRTAAGRLRYEDMKRHSEGRE